MRWRFVDRVDEFEPWARISGRKSVSLEEYSLLARLGREGVLPESLVVESCVHLARWLAAKSSDFEQTCLLAGIGSFTFEREIGMGDSLLMTLVVQDRSEERLKVHCEVSNAAQGELLLSLIPLAETCDPENTATMWHEIHGQA